MTASIPLVTIDDMWHLTAPGRYDLIRGELRTMPPTSGLHGQCAATLMILLGMYVEQAGIGTVLGTSTGFVLGRNPDTLLAPDFAFVRAERLRDIADPADFLHMAPDLAVEGVSPWDCYSDVMEKVVEYLRAGTSLVWVVDPTMRTMTAFYPSMDARLYLRDDLVDAGDIIPGFQIRVSAIFE